jgi:hypothetical protein
MKSLLLRICTILVFGLGIGAIGPTAAVDWICTQDKQGADDEPGQKDLNEFCQGPASLASCGSTADFAIRWNWDVVGLTGKNTGDACALFDTDTPGDGLANYALCVTIEKSPSRQAAASPRIYACDNSRPDRCPGATLMTGNSTCSVAVGTTNDPFHSNAGDTTATCCVDLGDFQLPEAAALLDTCSYPSQQPNSDPSDCIKKVDCNTDLDCNDGDACTNDACNGGVCTHAVGEGNTCSDGDACTVNDTCNAQGLCVPGTKKTCDAGDQCNTGGTCDSTTGNCSAGTPKSDGTSCSDGNACTENDTCQSGSCQSGTPKTCPAGDQCNEASTCNTTTGVCSDRTPKPNGTTCEDGNACTENDTCQSGSCQSGTLKTCAAGDQCNNPGVCDISTGVCSTPSPKGDGTSCSDGNQCTTGDQCVAGVCTGVNNGFVGDPPPSGASSLRKAQSKKVTKAR